MDELEIIITSDGSPTLRNRLLNETYHSVHGAVQESMHVFIRHGLRHAIEEGGRKDLSILEVGFGTGLNALLTLQYATDNGVHIRYTSIEPFPLAESVWSKLTYGGEENGERFRELHAAPWEDEISLSPEFMLLKLKKPLADAGLTGLCDVIYFDAFAPAVQPELWSYAALQKVVTMLKPGGIFVTYSARGQLKRDLRSLGLLVETLPGPPGKHEMVRGTNIQKPGALSPEP